MPEFTVVHASLYLRTSGKLSEQEVGSVVTLGKDQGEKMVASGKVAPVKKKKAADKEE